MLIQSNTRKCASILSLLFAVLFILASCSSDEDPTATSVPVTATPTATSVGTSTSALVPTTSLTPRPNDRAIIAVSGVSEQVGINSEGSPPWLHNLGVTETLFLRNPVTDATEPWLATEWSVSEDLTSATIKISNVPEFRYIDEGGNIQSLGNVTAEDVAWSFNDASSQTNEESRHSLAGAYDFFFDEWTTVDDETITFDFDLHVPFWNSDFLGESGNGISVFPSAASPELAIRTVIGTGPYLVEEWKDNDEFTIVSAATAGAGDHWKFSPKTSRLTFWEVPDPEIRVAMLINGEVDVAEIDREFATQFFGGDWTTQPVGGRQLGIFFSGNLWEEVSAIDGEPLTRTTYGQDLPWIGNPDDPQDLQEAKSIRNALARAYDREEINRSVLGGVGSRQDVTYIDDDHIRFKEEWRYEFNLELARQIIRGESDEWPVDGSYDQGVVTQDQNDALNGNAFEISIYAGPEFDGPTGIMGVLADKVAGYWADLGLQVTTLKYPYRPDFRPTVVERTNTIPWITSCDEGIPGNMWHFTRGRVQTSLTRGEFGCGFEDPTILDILRRMNAERDESVRTEIADEYVAHVHHEALQPGIISVPGFFWVMNPGSVQSWEMGKSHAADGRLGHIGRPWNLELN